jgi:oligosaccharide amylase
MARALSLGNGQVLVNLDERGQLRDLYFPHVGLENQLGERNIHRVGIYASGQLSWLSDPAWQVSLNYESNSFVSEIVATHDRLGVRLTFTDLVYNEKNIFIRKVAVKNLAAQNRPIKVFFAHQFEPHESRSAHTAYFDPHHHCLIHYRNRRSFLMNAKLEGADFDDYSTGVFGAEGKEGTHIDAEDGQLSHNPIEHGQADSALGLEAEYAPGAEKLLYYWLAVGHSVAEVLELNTYVAERGPGHLIATTRDYWRAWVSRQNWNFKGLSPEIVNLFNKSLFIIRAHADAEGGIIASSDAEILQKGKDTYNYIWPRDAAVAAIALARAGDTIVARRYFRFCNEVLGDGEYFMHKYSPDKSLGSSWHPWMRDGRPELPIQEDETALVLIALSQYYDITKDIEFIEEIYNTVIKRTADFMVLYRNESTGLPRPSYNLWEERFGVSTFTASAVCAALRAAARFATILGKVKSGQVYERAAGEVAAAILRELYDGERGVFYNQIEYKSGEVIKDKTIDASSAYGVFAFGILPASDERLVRAFQATTATLTARGAGGIARYEGDLYQRQSSSGAGNPWFVTTLWLAQYQIRLAKSEAELEPVKVALEWVRAHAGGTGILSEQLDQDNGQPLSVAPLVWSHAEFVTTVIQYLDKLEELGVCKACNPVY